MRCSTIRLSESYLIAVVVMTPIEVDIQAPDKTLIPSPLLNEFGDVVYDIERVRPFITYD